MKQEEVQYSDYNMEQLNRMTESVQHPVMKKTIRQLIIESLAVILLLAFYYDIFDGDQKSFAWHIVLVTSSVLFLLHNMLGIYLVSNVELADNLKDSLHQYKHKIQRYAIVSIISRLLALAGLVLFMINGELSQLANWYSLAALVVIVFQFFLLYRIWKQRITKIRTSLKDINL